MNDALSLLMSRHCKRSFLDRPVPREILEAVLRAAAHAPSNRNSQPWQVAVLSGRAKDALAEKLCAQLDRGAPAKHDYSNRPPVITPAAQKRAEAAGAGVLLAKGIARPDEAARKAHVRDNHRFYGAPVELFFHLSSDAPPGAFLEMGFFAQNVMLGLVGFGLASCPQYSVTAYSDAIREHLGFGADRLIVCGMAVGYPDEAAPVNSFAPERASLEEYTQWFE